MASLASTEINICKDMTNEFNLQKINDLNPFTLMAKVGKYFKREDNKSEENGKLSTCNDEKVYFNS